jgi:hypothetical protein
MVMPRTHRPADTFSAVEGTWSVERRMVELTSGWSGTFSGTWTSVRVEPGRCRIDERGVLDFGGRVGDAGRTLLYDRLDDGTVEVRFADGGSFHDLDLRRGRWRATHLCGPDRYVGTFLLLSPDQLAVRWRCHGPTQRYVTSTLATRVGAPG